jgi:hypothetical protein
VMWFLQRWYHCTLFLVIYWGWGACAIFSDACLIILEQESILVVL